MKTKITLLIFFLSLFVVHAQIQVTEGTTISNNPNIIGCNNNTTLIEEPWNNENRISSLIESRVTNLRFPGGTVSENWDYRNDTFFPAKGTSGSEDGWVDPTQMIGFVKSIIENGTGKINSIENFSKAQEANDFQPVYVMNMTTPGLDYYAEKFSVPEDSETFQPLQPDWWRAFEDRLQRNLEMLRRAEASGMPVKFIELSNEVYFGAGKYQFLNFQGFREDNAGFGYPEACHYFITEIKKEFPNAKFSAVAYFDTEGSEGKRKDFWNGYVIPRLDRNLVDALTMHAYIESNPNQTATNQAELNTMLDSFRTVFDQAKINTDFANVVTAANWDVWWTEYMPNFFNIGAGVNQDRFSWENALVVNYNIASYLELPSSELLQMHEFSGMTTNNGGINAVGRAISLASLATSGMDQRQELSFSGISNLAGTNVPELFGFSFSDNNNKNFWITNASGENKTLDISNLGFSGKVMYQSAGTLGSKNDPMETVILPNGTIELPPNSITTLLTTNLPDIQVVAGVDLTLEDGGTFDFGTLRLGSNGVVNDFEITNLGGGNLNLSNITIDGANANDFQITVQPSTSLANRENTILSIKFEPTGDGTRAATVNIANNDPDESPFSFTLTGTTSRAFAFNRLDVTVIADGFKDIPYNGNDSGKQNTGLRLTSFGRVKDTNGNSLYTIWRVRNSSEENKQVVLKSVDNSFDYPFTIKKNKEAFIRSTYITNSATHKLFFEGNNLDTKASSQTSYADGRTVFVAKNGNVGGANPPGSVSSSNGAFTMDASGSGINGTSDQFRFIYERLEGDFEFTTKLSTVPQTGIFGIMVRKSNVADSENLFLGLSDATALVLQQRTMRGIETEQISTVSASAPIWLKVDRSGNRFTASYSTDGIAFEVLESTIVVFPFEVSLGLAGSSTINGQLATAVFEEAVIVPDSGQPEPDIALYDAGTNTLIASGSLDFGLIDLNTSKTKTINVTNVGTALLQLNSIVVEGPDAQLFTFQNQTGNTLEPGASAALEVTFTASQSSSRRASLIIESNDPEEATVTLSLNGQGPGNLLSNGDFEDPSKTPWTNAGTVVDDQTNARSGSKALRLFLPQDTPEGSRFFGAVQTVPVQPLGQYSVQGYFKGERTSETGAFRILIKFLDAGNNEIGQATSNFFANSPSYKLMTTSFTTPEGCTQVEVTPQILAATGTAWFDDIEMADNSNSEPTSILRNGDFNSGQKSPWTNGGTVETDIVNAQGAESPIMRLFRSSKGFSGSRQLVKINEGSTYNLSGKVKRSLTEGFSRFFVQFVDENGSYIQDGNGKNITKATQFGSFGGVDLTYKFIGLNNIVPPTGTANMEINLQLFNGTGSVWWEDIRLEEILPATSSTALRASIPIESIDSDGLFALYPNPASEYVTVSFSELQRESGLTKEIIKVRIYDMTGRVIASYSYGPNQFAKDSIIVPVETLEEGLYIFKIGFVNGDTEEKLLRIN
ncbi:choice-of-anchor D domain-containing protein [Flagellimonas sp. 389]|uniref:choice-of-anchor D domain-containing protein n=1 Tax=Flagellimonas sp. 389 TaxID=2835862 RepID=UPI001BD41DA3|nr:choice-of-anchor D domain-containing protein [Flagellimonas sp. 389]MBS9462590.1 choice-of-anchor D domain-containing protein [Flagellimonas sp. 389]